MPATLPVIVAVAELEVRMNDESVITPAAAEFAAVSVPKFPVVPAAFVVPFLE